MEKKKKLTLASLMKRKDEEFYFEGIKEPVKVLEIKDNMVYFTGKDRNGKIKDGKLPVDDFLKSVNAATSDAVDVAKEEPKKVTADMITVGFRWKDKLDAPDDFQVTKIIDGTVFYMLRSLIENPSAIPEGQTGDETQSMENFIKRIEAIETPAPVKIKDRKEIEVEITEKNGTENLACELTDEQVHDYAMQASQLTAERDDKDNQKRSFTAQLTGEIKELEARISTLCQKVNSKSEYKDVAIKIIYNWKKNKKTVIRDDTGEMVRESAIPAHELQNNFIE